MAVSDSPPSGRNRRLLLSDTPDMAAHLLGDSPPSRSAGDEPPEFPNEGSHRPRRRSTVPPPFTMLLPKHLEEFLPRRRPAIGFDRVLHLTFRFGETGMLLVLEGDGEAQQPDTRERGRHRPRCDQARECPRKPRCARSTRDSLPCCLPGGKRDPVGGDRRDDCRVGPRSSRRFSGPPARRVPAWANGAAAVLASAMQTREPLPVTLCLAWWPKGCALKWPDSTATHPHSSSVPWCARGCRDSSETEPAAGASAGRRRARARRWSVTTPATSPMKPSGPAGLIVPARGS